MPLGKAVDTVARVYFLAVMFLMYFFIEEAVYIGGIGITLRHVFALLLIASAFVYFIIKPDVARAAVSLKSAFVFAVPLLVVIVASMLVWVIDKSDVSTILRGISGCVIYTNWLSCALCAGAALFLQPRLF